MRPLLLDITRCQAAKSRLAQRLWGKTGELADYLAKHPATVFDLTGRVLRPGEPRIGRGADPYLPALARELMLLDPVVRAPILSLHPELAGACPFDPTGPSLRMLADRRCAIAAFPLAGCSGDEPCLAFTAAVEGEPTPYLIYLPGMKSDGASWTLAHGICLHFCTAGTQEDRINLASLWIITGKWGYDKISHVELGNKTEYHREIPHRIWIVPASNYRDPQLRISERLRYRVAHTLDDAIAHVTGKGSTRGGDMPWPDDIDELHSFVSAAKEPVIMAACLQKKGDITLWKSTDGKFSGNVETLKFIIENRLGKSCVTPEICSNDLAKAERTLLEYLVDKLSTQKRILFNYTQGNALMRSALLLLAQRFPNLWLFYFNVDNDQRLEFDLIRFPGNEALTQTMTAERPECGADWDRLLPNAKRPEHPPLSPEEWADYYFPGNPVAEVLP